MLVLIRSNDIVSDSRVNKYLSFYKSKSINYKVIGWDRLNDNINLENSLIFKRKVKFNLGSKAIFSRFEWFIYIIKSLHKLSSKVTTIHACDLDCAYPAAIYKLLYNKRVNLIFDVFDWYSSTLSLLPWYQRILITVFERFTVSKSDNIIICEEERIKQFQFIVKKHIYVLPNIPAFIELDNTFVNLYKFKNDNITVSYVGGFYKGRYLKELFNLATKGEFNLLIGGYGDKELEDLIALYSSQFDNIRFFGKVSYPIGLSIMNNSDLIYAMYEKQNPNHIYAAPNKFYEGLMLGKPIITTNGTLVGEKVISHKSGFVIEESEEELSELLFSINKEKKILNSFYNPLTKTWNDKYINLTEIFLLNTYIGLIKQ